MLIRAGWQLETVQMVDQFVRTAALEMVAVLRHPGRQTKAGQKITTKRGDKGNETLFAQLHGHRTSVSLGQNSGLR